MFQIPVPIPMDIKGDMEGKWTEFKESWEDYSVATGLDKKDNKIQVATLRSIMGTECRKRLASLSLSEVDSKDPSKILEALTKHFTPHRNVLYDRFVFFNDNQQPHEPVDTYVSRLRQLVGPCKFGDLQEEMLRCGHGLHSA